jgi:GNAT superfamily N-acetyltransferase
VDLADIDVRAAVDGRHLDQLLELFAGAWWTASRTAGDVAAMLAGTDIVVALVHRSTDRLVGFARAITDGVYLAVVLDVIVAPDMRGEGLGGMLLDAIVGHERLTAVRSVELVCQPEMLPFYRRWGFTDRVGTSQLMRRSSDPLLAPPA